MAIGSKSALNAVYRWAGRLDLPDNVQVHVGLEHLGLDPAPTTAMPFHEFDTLAELWLERAPVGEESWRFGPVASLQVGRRYNRNVPFRLVVHRSRGGESHFVTTPKELVRHLDAWLDGAIQAAQPE